MKNSFHQWKMSDNSIDTNIFRSIFQLNTYWGPVHTGKRYLSYTWKKYGQVYKRDLAMLTYSVNSYTAFVWGESLSSPSLLSLFHMHCVSKRHWSSERSEFFILSQRRMFFKRKDTRIMRDNLSSYAKIITSTLFNLHIKFTDVLR